MIFKEKHDIKIGSEMTYRDYKGIERVGTVVALYPHFVQLKSENGYNVSKLNADLFVEMGWK